MIQSVACRLMNERPRREQITRVRSINSAHRTVKGSSRNTRNDTPKSSRRVEHSSSAEAERRSVLVVLVKEGAAAPSAFFMAFSRIVLVWWLSLVTRRNRSLRSRLQQN